MPPLHHQPGRRFPRRDSKFVALVQGRQVEEAKGALSHGTLLQADRASGRGPSASSIKIDGHEDVVEEGMAFTGYHRLEKDLWVDGLPG